MKTNWIIRKAEKKDIEIIAQCDIATGISECHYAMFEVEF